MYIRRKGAGLMGFGDAASCGPTQQWDPNCVFNGIKGQCVPTGTVGKAAGCTYPASSGDAWYDKLFSSATDILKAKLTPAPVTNITTTSNEMSTTTKVAIAGAGVLAVLLILKSRKG